MKLDFTPHFKRSYFKAQPHIQRAFDKQSALRPQDFRHPALRAKKYDEGQGPMEARVTGAWHFYFKIVGDTYRLEEIKAIRNSTDRESVDRFLAASPGRDASRNNAFSITRCRYPILRASCCPCSGSRAMARNIPWPRCGSASRRSSS